MLRASNQNKLHTTLLSFTLLSQSLHSLISPSSRRLSRTTHFEVQVLLSVGGGPGLQLQLNNVKIHTSQFELWKYALVGAYLTCLAKVVPGELALCSVEEVETEQPSHHSPGWDTPPAPTSHSSGTRLSFNTSLLISTRKKYPPVSSVAVELNILSPATDVSCLFYRLTATNSHPSAGLRRY